jgi:hypothetical protein
MFVDSVLRRTFEAEREGKETEDILPMRNLITQGG